jgi:hypothetical protein
MRAWVVVLHSTSTAGVRDLVTSRRARGSDVPRRLPLPAGRDRSIDRTGWTAAATAIGGESEEICLEPFRTELRR